MQGSEELQALKPQYSVCSLCCTLWISVSIDLYRACDLNNQTIVIIHSSYPKLYKAIVLYKPDALCTRMEAGKSAWSGAGSGHKTGWRGQVMQSATRR